MSSDTTVWQEVLGMSFQLYCLLTTRVVDQHLCCFQCLYEDISVVEVDVLTIWHINGLEVHNRCPIEWQTTQN